MKVSNASLKQARRIFSLCLDDGELNESRLSKVVNLLSKKRNRQAQILLSAILRVLNSYLARRKVRITSANSLEEKEKQTILESIGDVYGKTLDFSYQVDRNLIAGLKIQIGDNVWDGSLSLKIRQLEQNLTQA